MKEKVNFVVLSFATALTLSSCGSDSSDSSETAGNILNSDSEVEKSSENSDVSSPTDTTVSPDRNTKYWGEWREVKTQKELYITSQSNFTIEEVGTDLIKIDENYYFRFGTRNVNFSGSVSTESDITTKAIKSFEGIGSIDVVLKNIKDSNIQAKTVE
jgi:hypothetical protein